MGINNCFMGCFVRSLFDREKSVCLYVTIRQRVMSEKECILKLAPRGRCIGGEFKISIFFFKIYFTTWLDRPSPSIDLEK